MFGSARRGKSTSEMEENVEKLRDGERELVALGAALTSNSAPCVEYHIAEARKAGFSNRQLEEAVRLADDARRIPSRKVLEAALEVLSEPAAAAAAPPGGKAGSVAANEQEPAAASGEPEDSPGREGSRSDRRCCC